jgi:hypothetical protein
MKAISRWLAVVGASAALATCLVTQTIAAPGSAAPALAIPKDLSSDVHMPATGYSIQTIFEDVSVGLHSPAGVANQFAQYAAAVRSAGWQEKAQRRGDKSSELDVVNGISEVDISLDRDNGTDIRLHVHCQRQIGDRETCDGVASDLPPSPPDAQISTPQHLGVTLEVKTNPLRRIRERDGSGRLARDESVQRPSRIGADLQQERNESPRTPDPGTWSGRGATGSGVWGWLTGSIVAARWWTAVDGGLRGNLVVVDCSGSRGSITFACHEMGPPGLEPGTNEL